MIDNVSRLELLRMAREMVINEHVDRRAEIHNKWVNESNELWTAKRQRLAYPSIPPYPTEKDIVERARALLEFISDRTDNTVAEKKIEEKNQNAAVVQETKAEVSMPDTTAEDSRDVSTPDTANENVTEPETKAEVSTPDKTNEKPTDENPRPFVDPLEYAKAKVGRDLDENSTAAGRVLPIAIKKFFRSNSE